MSPPTFQTLFWTRIPRPLMILPPNSWISATLCSRSRRKPFRMRIIAVDYGEE
jgi:hypothetical protein